MLDEFYELVVSICDNLYANRQLITKKSVQKAVCLHGQWTNEQLELQLPKFINNWRLHNLANDGTINNADKISLLEAQLNKYKIELQQAQQAINKLKAQLFHERNSIKQQREQIIAELRNLLAK